MSDAKYILCQRMEKRMGRAVCAILWRQANQPAGEEDNLAPSVCRGCPQGAENHDWYVLRGDATKTRRHEEKHGGQAQPGRKTA